jgi:hypothetical protein
LERARFAAQDNDPEALLDAVEDAVAMAVPGDRGVRRRAARLAATWADILANPESHRHHDPALARRLAEAAILWNPRGVGAFVDFAWATLALGDLDASRRALDKVALADPDHPELEALRMEIDERASQSEPDGDPRD